MESVRMQIRSKLEYIDSHHLSGKERRRQELLEALKHEAPFWKREWSGGVGRWVAGNTPL